ncbi:uncharacterized protein LOC143024344 isoform X1 [Oratosquilla oratoria]|uniref:uncharacterized protein LOC143024344 isoform X1 n=1 Tax=Oratosquilla oratoria TaxID=337810 RepID=UPI003F764533
MVGSNGPKVLILNSCTIGFLKNHKDPAHPDEPEITSMDADIDLHLDTASTLQVLCITSKLKWKSCQVHWMRTLVSTDHLLALHNSIRPVNHKK